MLCLVVNFCYADTNWQNKFDPQRYEQGLMAAISREAKLTQRESEAFFPIYKEMRKKMMEIYKKQRSMFTKKPSNGEQAMLEAIKNFDATEIELKKLQQSYHQRLLKKLPASKVFMCIKAEERYNRQMMRDMAIKNAPKVNPQNQHHKKRP